MNYRPLSLPKLCLLLPVLMAAGITNLFAGRLIKHYGTEDGLPTNYIYCGIQDSKGYIWLATENGVSRFDGKTFRNFSSANGMPDNDILDIQEDATGRIWVSCYNGQACYIKGNTVYSAANDTALKKICSGSYSRFCYANKKLVSVNERGTGAYEADSSGKITMLPLHGIQLMGFDQNILSYHTGRSSKYILFDNNYRPRDSIVIADEPNPVVTVSRLGGHCLVLIYRNGHYRKFCVQNNRVFPKDSGRMNMTASMIYTAQGQYWANNDGHGIVPVNADLSRDFSRSILFERKLISYFFADREGNYWGCTPGEGLYMVPNNGFSYYNRDNGLFQDNILRIASFGNEVYLGYNNTIIQSLNKGRISGYELHAPASIQGKITCMYACSGHIFAGTHNGLIIINRQTKQVRRIGIRGIKCLHAGENNTVLIGISGRCFRLSMSGDLIDTVFRGRTTAVCARRNGDVLTGTLHGIFRCRKNNGSWQADTFKTGMVLENTSITAIEELEDGTIVAGTVQKGILLCKGNDIAQLPAGNCKALFTDRNKCIWVATGSGICRITPGKNIHSYALQKITQFNGLRSDDVSDIVVAGDSVYAAGSKGLTVFPLTGMYNGHESPVVYINDMLANTVSREISPETSLPADSGNIVLHISAIDFKSMGNILFKYRMTGINDQWQYTTQHIVHFESLPPGRYRFEVYAMNSSNTWSVKPAITTIIIRPRWWQTTWFGIVWCMAGIVSVYFIIRLLLLRKHGRELAAASLKRQLAETELKAIKAQINPHFIFNTLNAIQYFINSGEHEMADHYLSHMALLLRKTLDFSGRTTVSVAEEIAYLDSYLQLEKLRFDDNFRYDITSNLSSDSHIMMPPMVLQPHVENALKHGLKQKHSGIKKLDLRFALTGNELVCEVTDNGIGRAAATMNRYTAGTLHRSLGTELSHTKLQMYEQLTGKKVKTEIIDQFVPGTEAPAGTLVRISISL